MTQSNRDDFSEKTKKILQERVGNRCSNPKCRCLTSGPNAEDDKATRIGVGAHITAAAYGGPRYDDALSSEDRKSIQNAIWLCQNCAKLVDSDSLHYPVGLLLRWKAHSEDLARIELEGGTIQPEFESEGYYCPYCDTFVRSGKFICLGCQAELAYGSTKQEWQNDVKSGMSMGGLLVLTVFCFLPNLVSKIFSVNLPALFGINIFVLLIFGFIVAFSSGFFWAKRCDTEKRNMIPRFIRNMEA
jgi:ribosomal protein L37AE/L43A